MPTRSAPLQISFKRSLSTPPRNDGCFGRKEQSWALRNYCREYVLAQNGVRFLPVVRPCPTRTTLRTIGCLSSCIRQRCPIESSAGNLERNRLNERSRTS